jgi:hypothetical protein
VEDVPYRYQRLPLVKHGDLPIGEEIQRSCVECRFICSLESCTISSLHRKCKYSRQMILVGATYGLLIFYIAKQHSQGFPSAQTFAPTYCFRQKAHIHDYFRLFPSALQHYFSTPRHFSTTFPDSSSRYMDNITFPWCVGRRSVKL